MTRRMIDIANARPSTRESPEIAPMPLSTTLRSLRRHLLPPQVEDLGWAPVWSLLYLAFLFMTWDDEANWLRPTLVSIVIFLPLYFRCYWLTGARQLIHVAIIATLAFALVPFNQCAHTYLIYAAVFLPFSGLTLRTSFALIVHWVVEHSMLKMFGPFANRCSGLGSRTRITS